MVTCLQCEVFNYFAFLKKNHIFARTKVDNSSIMGYREVGHDDKLGVVAG